jgi:hypothetical protein
MFDNSLHTFHIPVMGLAYTIDSPMKVARFGINSVVSIIEDNLLEKMRSYYYPLIGETYQPITKEQTDYRAKRITDYLNLTNRIVKNQEEILKNSYFDVGSEICRYFEMLPNDSNLKNIYLQMMKLGEGEEKTEYQNWLREEIKMGSIDVNIMTKLDKNNNDELGNVIEDGSDAVAALRGFVNSDLVDSSIILSAGMNPRLFAYMEKRNEFDADDSGIFTKKIVIKVSDYRSALIQGKMLAKKGLWVSEFRIESGLNCGGHAFASAGYLLGPIMEEFRTKKGVLINDLFEIYNQALIVKGKKFFDKAHQIKITVQGGIGTNRENDFLHEYYGVDGTGWGTPFLLVPEATTVDEHTSTLLIDAKENDVVLSKKSPLGIPFHYLKGTTADHEKLARIETGKPGSPCPEKFLASNTEFSNEPICTASREYQKKKIKELQSLNLSESAYNSQLNAVLDKECLCIGLSNSAIKKYSITPFKKLEAVNICPGPNIAYFSEILSLRKMVDHIYGRDNVLKGDNRPHMFIKELYLYIDYLINLMKDNGKEATTKQNRYVQKFYNTMMEGIAYYREMVSQESVDPFLFTERMMVELEMGEEKLKDAYEFHVNMMETV